MWSNIRLAHWFPSIQLTTILELCSALYHACSCSHKMYLHRQKETLPTSLSHESGWLRDRDHTADSTSAYSSDVRHGGPTKQLLFVELKWSQNEHVFV